MDPSGSEELSDKTAKVKYFVPFSIKRSMIFSQAVSLEGLGSEILVYLRCLFNSCSGNNNTMCKGLVTLFSCIDLSGCGQWST